MKCHRELELLEYFLENLEYESVIAEEGVHDNGQRKNDIIEVDDMEERLADNLTDSTGNSN